MTTSLRCMEIWGGNHAVEDAVSVPGIDAWVYSSPYHGHAGGGDVHYVSMCAAGRIARFAIADVSGHGAAVSELGVALRDLMRRSINTADQTRITRELNSRFLGRAGKGRFATALLATYFAPTDHLILTNAGHPRPLWYRADRGEWLALSDETAERSGRVANLPLGIIEPTEYMQVAVRLGHGDLVVMYTDSLIEAADEGGNQLGEAGLVRASAALNAADPFTLGRGLVDAAARFRGGREPGDDVTVMVLHHNAADPPRQSLTERVRVTAKMLGLSRV